MGEDFHEHLNAAAQGFSSSSRSLMMSVMAHGVFDRLEEQIQLARLRQETKRLASFDLDGGG
jgi:hypothetical protein